MSTGRIGNSNPNASAAALTPGAMGLPRPDDGKVRDTSGIIPGAPPTIGDSDPSEPTTGKDYGVHISDSAKHRADNHRKALNIARNTPDIREDRVASLKKQIDDGSYQADAGKIADGILREAIKDHLAESEQ